MTSSLQSKRTYGSVKYSILSNFCNKTPEIIIEKLFDQAKKGSYYKSDKKGS